MPFERKWQKEQMTIVGVCHRPSTVKYDEQVLELVGNASLPSEEYRFAS